MNRFGAPDSSRQSRQGIGKPSLSILLGTLIALVLPVLAYAATSLPSWRSSSVVARAIGPLPSVTWQPSAADYDPQPWGAAYQFTSQFDTQPLRLSGVAPVQGIFTARVTIPSSEALGFDEVLAGTPGAECILRVFLDVGDSDEPPGLIYRAVRNYAEGSFVSFEAGTFSSTGTIWLDPAQPAWLSSLGVTIVLGCHYWDEDAGTSRWDVELPLAGTPQIQVAISSIRVLAY